jgi:hypothetical protein
MSLKSFWLYPRECGVRAGYWVVSFGSCAYSPLGLGLLDIASMGDWIVSLGSCGYGQEGLSAVVFLVWELGGITLNFCLSPVARGVLVVCVCP